MTNTPHTIRVKDAHGYTRTIDADVLMSAGRQWALAYFTRGPAMNCPQEVFKYLSAAMAHHKHEVFAVLFLDSRHRVIAFEELFFGTVDGASVYPRTVVRQALQHNAAAVVLVHNHPSQVSEPSRADRALTRRLQDALALIDVRVIDHVVVGTPCTSFAESGLL